MNSRKRLRTMPLVVLFKSESDGPDKFVKALEEKFETKLIYCLSFQFRNLDKLREKLQKHDDYEGLLLTSQRSVFAIHKASEPDSSLIENWKKKSNFCVGKSTSDMAKNLLEIETNGKGSGNAIILSKLIVDKYKEEANPKTFLFPAGNLKQDTMEKTLKENLIDVESIEIYETIQHEELEKAIKELKIQKLEYFAYFSPSGVKFSLPLLRKYEIDLSQIKIIAIGPSTKKALEDSDLQCYRMCSNPSPESLLEALSS